MNMQRCLIVLTLLASTLVSPVFAAVNITKVDRDGKSLIVMENDTVKLEIWLEAGAAITSYVDKRNNVEFVAGQARLKGAYHAWKDVTRLSHADDPKSWLGAQPYSAEIKDNAVIVTCEVGHIRNEREMRLADTGAKLTVVTRHTNISKEPQTIWARWHPYMQIGDIKAQNSVILMPGPDATTVRRITVGQGYEGHFMDVPGYWMAVDSKTGVGMWMTFDCKDEIACATWTDYNFTDHPKRGWFVAEVYPNPKRTAPGETVEMHYTYQPFVGADAGDALTMDHVRDTDRPAAKRFAALARANATVLLHHSMQPGGGDKSGADNRFNFSHKRRDRFALLDWGIVDAMMSVPGDQEAKAIRTRLSARAYDTLKESHAVMYRFTLADFTGKELKREQWEYTVSPGAAVMLEERKDVSLAGLPDGRYSMVLAAYVDGANDPVHKHVQEVKLSGRTRAELSEARRQRDATPFLERERPFVKALREVTLTDGTVPIGVEEGSGIARQNWPVRVGVPFAQGALARDGHVKLTSPAGAEVAAQTDVLATWLDGSVKWLLVDFAADVPANGHVFYTLTKAAGVAGEPIARQDGSAILVNTGVRQWRLEGNVIDANLWWETGAGKRYTFKLAGDEAGLTIDTNGSQRALVKAVGWYFAEGDPKPIARGELRAEFYRGQKHFKLEHTYTYAGDPWNDTLGSTGIAMRFAGRKFANSSIELDGKLVTVAGPAVLLQPSEFIASVGDQAGHRASGAVSLASSGDSSAGKANVYHRNLWKMFPKRVDSDPAAGTVTFHYWPKEAGALDWRPDEDGWIPSSGSPEALAIGVSRTHEFIIDDQGAFDPAQLEETFDQPVIAITPPRYLCDTDAIHGLSPYDPVKCPQLENAISESIDSYNLHREVYGWYGQWFYGSLPNMYDTDRLRWMNFGRYGNILNEQDIAHAPWLAYARSGDRKHLVFAEAYTRHLMDVGSIRLHTIWPDMVGLSRRHHECVWLGPGDYGHSMLDPYLEMYHVMGHKPAWEAAQRLAVAMSKQQTGTWRYLSNPLAGLSRMYLDTGDKFYKESADRIWTQLCNPDKGDWWTGDHGGRASIYYSMLNPECAKIFREFAETKPGSYESIDAQNELYRLTGDAKYLANVQKLFAQHQKDVASYDPQRQDPMTWSASAITQHVLAMVRQWCYASQTLQAAGDAKP